MGAYYPSNLEGYGQTGGCIPIDYRKIAAGKLKHETNDPGRVLGSSSGGFEIKGIFSHFWSLPFLTGGNFLTKDNSIQLRTDGELSPVSLNGIAELTISPVAFAKISAGIGAGTGWIFLGFNGMGRNLPGTSYSNCQAESFQGIVYRCWLSGTLQFDLAALFPGDWNHLVFAIVPHFQYRAYTGAGQDTAWQYENDDGQNFNGLKYIGDYFIGYRMPIFWETAGFLLETEEYCDANRNRSLIGNKGWGSDLVRLTFGPVFGFRFSDTASLTILPQFRNLADYSDETIGNRYFEFRKTEALAISF